MTNRFSNDDSVFQTHWRRLIRAKALTDESGAEAQTSFFETELERIVERDQKTSVLVLRSGFKISVALTFDELHQIIYEPGFRKDGPVIDLRAYTGAAGFPTQIFDARQDNSGSKKSPDKSIYAGKYGGKNMDGLIVYAAPRDAALQMNFNEAANYAQKLNKARYLGHDDWHVPTLRELRILNENSEKIGGFSFESAYWSSSRDKDGDAWCSDFLLKDEMTCTQSQSLLVRLVRTIPSGK